MHGKEVQFFFRKQILPLNMFYLTEMLWSLACFAKRPMLDTAMFDHLMPPEKQSKSSQLSGSTGCATKRLWHILWLFFSLEVTSLCFLSCFSSLGCALNTTQTALYIEVIWKRGRISGELHEVNLKLDISALALQIILPRK